MSETIKVVGAMCWLVALTGGPAACTSSGPGPAGADARDQSDARDQPDAGAPSDASPEALVIVSTEPVDGTRSVSIWAQPVIRFNHDVAQSSLDGAETALTYGRWGSRDLTTELQGDTLTVRPTRPLSYGETYTIQLSGLTSVDGGAMTPSTLDFTTFANPRTRDVRYTGGAISYWTEFQNDDLGRVIRSVQYDAPGPDGLWLTADDEVQSYSRYDYSLPGAASAQMHFIGAGPDGLWFTDDDELSQFSRSLSSSDGLPETNINYSSAGPDGLPYTDDDVVASIYTWTHAADSTDYVQYLSPGADGIWQTADDLPNRRWRHEYDAQRRLTSYASYIGPGPDGLWFTADDQLEWRYRYEYPGANARTMYYMGAATTVSWYSERVLSSDGTTTDTKYDGPGPDAVWFTGDDHKEYADQIETVWGGQVSRSTRIDGDGNIVSAYARQYESHGSMTRSVDYSGAGGDGSWGTADDVIAGYLAITYDDRGNRISYNRYDGPGPDGLWFSADDRLKSETLHDPSR